jgi:hypothetical protein
MVPNGVAGVDPVVLPAVSRWSYTYCGVRARTSTGATDMRWRAIMSYARVGLSRAEEQRAPDKAVRDPSFMM